MSQPSIISAPPDPADAPFQQRRAPSQQRSRDRLERILAAATALITEGGSDAMKMSDLAESAGVSIGSLYQYFPDKGAVIRALAARYNAEGRACIAAALADVRDMDGLKEAFGKLIDIYYALFLAEPTIRDVWFGLQADKALRAFELAESRANGALLSDVLARLRPDTDPADLARSAFLIMSLGESTMRLAISVERAEGDALVEDFKAMVLRQLQSL